MHRCIRIAAVCLFFLCASLAFAQKRSITEKDLFQFNWIGDPQISPDASRVAFVKVTVNEKKDGYDTSIWSVSLRGDEPPPPAHSSVGLPPRHAGGRICLGGSR